MEFINYVLDYLIFVFYVVAEVLVQLIDEDAFADARRIATGLCATSVPARANPADISVLVNSRDLPERPTAIFTDDKR